MSSRGLKLKKWVGNENENENNDENDNNDEKQKHEIQNENQTLPTMINSDQKSEKSNTNASSDPLTKIVKFVQPIFHPQSTISNDSKNNIVVSNNEPSTIVANKEKITNQENNNIDSKMIVNNETVTTPTPTNPLSTLKSALSSSMTSLGQSLSTIKQVHFAQHDQASETNHQNNDIENDSLKSSTNSHIPNINNNNDNNNTDNDSFKDEPKLETTDRRIYDLD